MKAIGDLSLGELNDIVKSVETVQNYLYNDSKINSCFYNNEIVKKASNLKIRAINAMIKKISDLEDD